MFGDMLTAITLEMPAEAAERLLAGYESNDPKFVAMMKEFGIVEVRRYNEPYYNPDITIYSGLAI